MPPSRVLSAEFPTTTPTAKVKKTEKDMETKTISSRPSLQKKSGRKKKKEPLQESEQEEESTKETGSSGGDKEEEPATPPLDKRQKMDTWSSDKKKSGSTFKTLVAPKRPEKIPKKGGSSQKKPRGK